MTLTKLNKVFKGFKNHKLCSIIGTQWGDEGKGKLVDFLAPNFDFIARFNGGSNAGHTVYIKDKKYAFHILPCGMLYPNVKNVIGVVVDPESLTDELDILKKEGFETEHNLHISKRAHLLFKFHKLADEKNEFSLGDKKLGTTKRGIGPCYSTKSLRLGVRVGDLAQNFETFKLKYKKLLDYFTENFGIVHPDEERELTFLQKFRNRILPLCHDTEFLCQNALMESKTILAEGANATMLDIDHGTYPFVTSSHATNAGIYCGLGIPPQKGFSIGVVKAYATRVGEGPFPTELFDDVGEKICQVGAEFGTTTGRKRRIGWIDIPIINYSARLNGFDVLNLTKLDVLSELDEIKMCTQYSTVDDFFQKGQFPVTEEEIRKIKPHYESFPGWKCDIKHMRKYEELPLNARNFVERIEHLVGLPIRWIGVDKARDGFVIRGD